MEINGNGGKRKIKKKTQKEFLVVKSNVVKWAGNPSRAKKRQPALYNYQFYFTLIIFIISIIQPNSQEN